MPDINVSLLYRGRVDIKTRHWEQLYRCLGILPVNSPSKCLQVEGGTQGVKEDTPDLLLPYWNQSSSFNEPCVYLFAHNPLNLCSVTAAWIQPAGEAEALAKTQTRKGWVKKKLCTTTQHDDLHDSLNPTWCVSVRGCVHLYMHVYVCMHLCVKVCVGAWVPMYVCACMYVCGAGGGCWVLFIVVYSYDSVLMGLQKHMTATSCQ